MPDRQPSDSLWTDVAPATVISQAELPGRTGDFARSIDDWIDEHAGYVDPFDWEDGDERYWRKKMFLEAAGYVLNVRGSGVEDPLPAVHDVVVDRVNDRRFAHKLLRSPRDLHHYAVPVLYGRYVDELDAAPAEALERTADLGAFRLAERLPMRRLEFWALSRYLSALFGGDYDWYDPEAILDASILNNQPNVARSTISDAYCLTHDVLFYNNYLGVCETAFPDGPAPYEATTLLRGLILRYMAADNCDIVSELVLSGVMQRQLSRGMVQLALSWLLEKAEPNGYVPGPELKKEQVMSKISLDTPDVDDVGTRWDYDSREEAIWGKNYHTNIVAGTTAHFVHRDWEHLEDWSGAHTVADESFRRDVCRLGELLKSLGEYDLEGGARQMRALSDSPVRSEFQGVFEQAVEFLTDQRTRDGEYGYWADEEVVYTNAGNSTESFRAELVAPVTEACRAAIEAVEADGMQDTGGP